MMVDTVSSASSAIRTMAPVAGTQLTRRRSTPAAATASQTNASATTQRAPPRSARNDSNTETATIASVPPTQIGVAIQ